MLLDSDEDLERWLACDPAHGISSVADLLRPYPGKLEVYPVPSLVNKVGNDSPDCIAHLSAATEAAVASPSSKRRRGASGSPELAATRKITAFFSPTGKPAKAAKSEPLASPAKPKRARSPSPEPTATATEAQDDDAATTAPQHPADRSDGADDDDPDICDADADVPPNPFADNPEWQTKSEALRTCDHRHKAFHVTVSFLTTSPHRFLHGLNGGDRGTGLLGQRGGRGVTGV